MSVAREDTIYTFDGFELDAVRKLLVRGPGGESVPLTLKAFEVLLLLVENAGNLVTKDELMEKVWRDSVVEEANLTQTISVLRKTLGENPKKHRYIVTESGKGYRFVAFVEESVKVRPSNYGETAGKIPETEQKPAFSKAYVAVILIFCAAVLLTGSYYLWTLNDPGDSKNQAAKKVRSIAVLPFRSTEQTKENRIFGIGMADAVITRLSQIKSVVVRQTNTVIRYADTTPEALKIGREINVDAILEGNIQQAEGRIRVSVRLFRVDDGELLWAESFDELDADIFALQDSISLKVANSLSLKLNPEEREKLNRRHTENIEAFNLYNKGRYFWNNRSSEDLRKSIGLYEQAIALDPNYATAYAGLAENYVVLHLYSPTREKALFPKAKAAAEKALSLDADLAEAHTALGLYQQLYEYNWDAAEREFKLAISVNPNYATAYQWYGEFLATIGRTDESIVMVKRALELDPLSLSTNSAQAYPYIAAGRWNEAFEKIQPALELDENFPFAMYYLARSYDGLEKNKEAIVMYRKAIKAAGGSALFTSTLIGVLQRDGQKAEAKQEFGKLLEAAETNSISRYVLARGFAALGNNEKAYEELDKAYAERDALLVIVKFDQNFFHLHDEKRFQEILRKMNL